MSELADFLQELSEARRQLEDANSKLDSISQKLTARGAEATHWMTRAEYARYRRASPSSVDRWIREGMPVERRGRRVLIKPQVADAWTPEDHIEESAKRAAHGGSG